MSTGKGRYLGGVRDFEGIKNRCTIPENEDDPCWLWNGAVDTRGLPKLWFSPFNSTVTIACVMCFLKTGERPGSGHAWYAKCLNRSCGNPAHWTFGTLSQATLRHPRKNPKLHAAKVAASRRVASRLDDAIVAEIRSGQDTLQAMAQRHGMSKSTISRIRRGVAWKPLAIPASSVFAWGSGA